MLSPLLWNLIVGGLLLGVRGFQTYIQAYADAIVLLFQGSGMSELHTEASRFLVIIGRWADDNDLVFSAGTSKSIVFTWRRHWNLQLLLLGGFVIPRMK